MRKGFDGLYGLVCDRLLCEPLSGHLFLFCNAQRMDPRRQPTGRTEDRGDPFGRGKLPEIETPSARLSGRDSPRTRSSPDPTTP